VAGRLIVVTGTGTGIGKTHVSCALLRSAGKRAKAFGYKPIESGVDGTARTDAEALAEASSFHVKPAPEYRLRAALSPHLAARLEGVTLALDPVARFVSDVRSGGVHVLVELPGGLFTPVTDALRNVDLVRALAPDVVLLLAPNRLGVLHDVGAATAAAAHASVRIDAVGLVAQSVDDASTSTNADELAQFGAPLIGLWPRGRVDELAVHPATLAAVDRWVR